MRSGKVVAIALSFAGLLGSVAAAGVEPGTETEPPEQAHRLEFDFTGHTLGFHVTQLGESGFIVTQSVNIEGGGRSFVFRKYDSEFRERWTTTHVGDRKQRISREDIDRDTVHQLLVRYRRGGDEFELLGLNIQSGEIQVVRNAFPPKFSLVDFGVSGAFAWFAGAVKKEALVLAVELETKEIRRFPVSLDGRNEVKTIFIDRNSGHVNVVINNLADKKNTLAILTFSGEGEEIARIHLDSEVAENQLTNARIFHGEDGQTTLIGTYTLAARRSLWATMSEQPRWGAQGLFLARLAGGENAFIKYHSFTEFENFFSFLPEKKQRKKEAKRADKKAGDSEPKLHYRLVLHDPIRQDQTYIIVAEAFFPVYSGGGHSVNPDGTMTFHASTFHGNHYTHAVVAAFDEDGEKVWDQCFSINNTFRPGYRTRSRDERVVVSPHGEELNLIYVDDNVIESLTIRDGVAAEERVLTEIETGQEESASKISLNEAEFWYGNSFLVWGLENFRKHNPLERRKRRFIVSRVDY